jgi:hypothetical protein
LQLRSLIVERSLTLAHPNGYRKNLEGGIHIRKRLR